MSTINFVKKSISLQKAISLPNLLIEGTCPVPFFGDLHSSKVATIGLNPSNLEFMDLAGNELEIGKRLPTLSDFQLPSWLDSSEFQIQIITSLLLQYFEINPYRRWFDKLDSLFHLSGYSYYNLVTKERMCHIDLVPFATSRKWSHLKTSESSMLLSNSRSLFKDMLSNSGVEIIFLNGSSICREIENALKIEFKKERKNAWDIKTKKGVVKGYSYSDHIEINNKKIRVLGINHNIQSSFGVSKSHIASISEWLSKEIFDGIRVKA